MLAPVLSQTEILLTRDHEYDAREFQGMMYDPFDSTNFTQLKGAGWLALLGLILTALPGCNNVSGNEQIYSLTTIATPSEGGSITPESGEFDEGSVLEMEAHPDDGYLFGGWEGDLTGHSNPDTL